MIGALTSGSQFTLNRFFAADRSTTIGQKAASRTCARPDLTKVVGKADKLRARLTIGPVEVLVSELLGTEGDCSSEGSAIFVTARARLRKMSRMNS